MSINFINNAHHEKMLVKVRNKVTGKDTLVTKRAYEMAKKNYEFLGHESDDNANVFNPNKSVDPTQTISTPPPAETQTTSTSSIPQDEGQADPNSKPTADESEKDVAVVENNTPPPTKKRGRPAKNQISSPAAISEV